MESPQTTNLLSETTGMVRVDAAAGTPPSLTRRHVYIYQPSQNAMQSGLLHTNTYWRIDFDNGQPRWENPLVGWTSSRDPVQGVVLKFRSSAEAVRFAERQGWSFTVREPQHGSWKQKSYSNNFVYSADSLKLIKTK